MVRKERQESGHEGRAKGEEQDETPQEDDKKIIIEE
jgi:hypothetical protein